MEKEKDGNANINKKRFVFSTQETCDFFNISREALSGWAKKGAPKEGRGKWDIQKLVEWRFGGAGKESPELRKLKAEADLKESKAAQEAIKLAITEGRYVPVDKVTKDLRRLFSVLKKSLMTIGHSIATEINSIDAESAVIANNVVDEKISEALEQLSRSGVYGKK